VRPPRPAPRLATLATLATLAALAALAVIAPTGPLAATGCSATSEPIGNGACDGFCNRVVNLRCQQTLARDACVASCLYEQALCPETTSEVIRCSANEGALACDGSTLAPHVVNCDPARATRDACLQRTPPADASVPDGTPLPSAL
jgi:hypothetical protein